VLTRGWMALAATGALAVLGLQAPAVAGPAHDPAGKTLPTVTKVFSGPATPVTTADGVPVCGATGSFGTTDIPIVVSGVPRGLTDVSLTLNLRHLRIGDLQVVLIAPGGASAPQADVLDHIGSTFVDACGDNSNVEGVYTFDDHAASTPWAAIASLADDGTLASGSYRASGYASSAARSLTDPFRAIDDPNGTWILRVYDSYTGFVATVKDVSLSLSSPDPAPCATAGTALAAAQAALAGAEKKVLKAKHHLRALKHAHAAPRALAKAHRAVKRARKELRAARAAVAAAQAQQVAVC
jgi:hypothetical protein